MIGTFRGIGTVLLGLSLGLSGCATDTIRLDRAGTMVAAGRQASDSTAALMDKARATNREVLIELVASDPQCSMRRPVIAGIGDPRVARFCRRGAVPDRDGAFELQRIVPSDFQPTLAVIAALAGYLDSVESVLSRKPLDIAGDLAAAESDLRVILGAAQAVAGSTAPLPELNADQQAAAAGALQLLSVVLDERQRVDDLRRIESPETRALFARTLDALDRADKLWLAKYENQLANNHTLLNERLARLDDQSADRRRPEAAALLQVIEERESVPSLRAALFEVVNALGASHQAYLELLDKADARLTDAERRKRAQINRERAIGALKSLTSLIKAF